MYLDLVPRDGKYVHSAHFTVRCGCSIRNGPSDESVYQIPTVALICNLSPSHANMDIGGLLTHSEVETVFHEFGHALHSLLSRTSFQHLSGTRVAMDFVETPSHLMEQFVWNKEFLKIIGTHHLTKEPLSDKNIEKLIQSRFSLKAIDIQNQIIHSIFDQTIFGQRETWKDKNTIEVFAKLHMKYSFPYADGTHWFSRFGHLITYGAGYYSYLYSNIFASDIWATCFEYGDKVLSRKSGEKLWNNLLAHGGSKDPNKMLFDVLGREPV
jgi:intermediate peptidase